MKVKKLFSKKSNDAKNLPQDKREHINENHEVLFEVLFDSVLFNRNW